MPAGPDAQATAVVCAEHRQARMPQDPQQVSLRRRAINVCIVRIPIACIRRLATLVASPQRIPSLFAADRPDSSIRQRTNVLYTGTRAATAPDDGGNARVPRFALCARSQVGRPQLPHPWLPKNVLEIATSDTLAREDQMSSGHRRSRRRIGRSRMVICLSVGYG